MTAGELGEIRADEPGSKRWLSVGELSLVLATVSYFTVSGISFPVLPRLVDQVVGGEESEVGMAFAAFGVGLMVVRPFVAYLADRFGRRPLIAVAAVIAMVSQLLYVPAAEAGLVPLLAIRFVTGIGGSGMYVALATVATELPSPQRRARVFSIFSASTFLGFAIGPLIGESVYELADFDQVYVVAALIAALPIALVWLFPETRPVTVEPRLDSLASLLHPVGMRLGMAAWVVIVVFMSFNAFVTDWSLELGSESARWVIFTFSVTALVMRLGSGRILDGDRRRLGTICYLVMASGALLQALAQSQLWLYAAAFVLAGGMAYLTPLLVLIGADSTAEHDRARLVATITFFNDLGASFALPLLGWVAEVAGFPTMYIIVGGLALFGLAYFRSPMLSQFDGFASQVASAETSPAAR